MRPAFTEGYGRAKRAILSLFNPAGIDNHISLITIDVTVAFGI